MGVFAYALPTFRLRGAYAGERLYFRILAMETLRLDALQKRKRNNNRHYVGLYHNKGWYVVMFRS